MADILLQEDYTPLQEQSRENLLLESSLRAQVENYKNIAAGDGMSVTENVR